MKHQIKVSITGRDGLLAEVVCVDHEQPCGAREVFDWDMANSMEQYQGEPIEFPAVDIDVIYADEDEGFVWDAADEPVSEAPCTCQLGEGQPCREPFFPCSEVEIERPSNG